VFPEAFNPGTSPAYRPNFSADVTYYVPGGGGSGVEPRRFHRPTPRHWAHRDIGRSERSARQRPLPSPLKQPTRYGTPSFFRRIHIPWAPAQACLCGSMRCHGGFDGPGQMLPRRAWGGWGQVPTYVSTTSHNPFCWLSLSFFGHPCLSGRLTAAVEMLRWHPLFGWAWACCGTQPWRPMLLTNLVGPEGCGAVLCWACCWRSVLAAILKLQLARMSGRRLLAIPRQAAVSLILPWAV
jgi:hypothetical protein